MERGPMGRGEEVAGGSSSPAPSSFGPGARDADGGMHVKTEGGVEASAQPRHPQHEASQNEKGTVAESGRSRCLFQLFAVISHKGDITRGHYICYVKCGGCWYCCDDAWITMVDDEAVAACQAYMLFYVHHSFADEGLAGVLGPQPGDMEGAGGVAGSVDPAAAATAPATAVGLQGLVAGMAVKPE